MSTLTGVAFNFLQIDPIKALFWSAVINGVISVPIMVVMMLLVSRSVVTRRLTPSRRLKLLGWLSTGVMELAIGVMLWTMV